MGKNAGSYAGFSSDAAIAPPYNAVPGTACEDRCGAPTTAIAGDNTLVQRAIQPRSFCVGLYLTVYNWMAATLWGYVLFLIFSCFLQEKGIPANPAVLYKHVELPLSLAQIMQIAEIFHSALGITRSSVFITAMQVVSRVHLVLFMFRLCPRGYASVGIIALLLAWTIVELIRYPYFGVQELLGCLRAHNACKRRGGATEGAAEDEEPAAAPACMEIVALLKWLRYSGFIVLYPLGIAGEVLCILAALPELKKYPHYPTPMPNCLNFEVNLYYLYLATLAAYVPGSVLLYTHMMQQRKKCLYGQRAASDDRKKLQ